MSVHKIVQSESISNKSISVFDGKEWKDVIIEIVCQRSH